MPCHWHHLRQRDPDRSEHCTIISGMKFNKGKCQVLHLEWSNARHRYRLGDERLQSSSAERNLGLVDSRLSMSQQCSLAAEKTNHIGVHQTAQPVKKGDFPHWCGLTFTTVGRSGLHNTKRS